MRIVFLCEYRKASANYNIALKMLDELKNRGIKVYVGYYIVDRINDIGVNSDYTKSDYRFFSIHSSQSNKYLKIKYDGDWSDYSSKQKCLFLLTHPRVLFSFINYHMDKK